MKDFIRILDNCLIRKSEISYFSSEHHHNEYSEEKVTVYRVRVQLLNKHSFIIRAKRDKFEKDDNIVKVKEKEFFDEVLKEITLLMNKSRKEI